MIYLPIKNGDVHSYTIYIIDIVSYILWDAKSHSGSASWLVRMIVEQTMNTYGFV